MPTKDILMMDKQEEIQTVPCRFVKIKGVVYVRVQDVIDLLYQFSEAEETDTKNRIKELAGSINSLQITHEPFK